jgi:hypothetical protein
MSSIINLIQNGSSFFNTVRINEFRIFLSTIIYLTINEVGKLIYVQRKLNCIICVTCKSNLHKISISNMASLKGFDLYS